MKRLALIAAVIAIATPAMAQTSWNSNRLGGTTYYNGTDSQGGMWNGTSNQIGGTRYDNFHGPNGQMTNCTTTHIGSTAYTNCN